VKQQILEVEAILSNAMAQLSMPVPDLTQVKAYVEEAQNKLLDLAQGIEDDTRN